MDQVRLVATACRSLESEVTVFCRDVREEIVRDIELEKRSVFAELKQVVTQLNNVKNFDGTRVRVYIDLKNGAITWIRSCDLTIHNVAFLDSGRVPKRVTERHSCDGVRDKELTRHGGQSAHRAQQLGQGCGPIFVFILFRSFCYRFLSLLINGNISSVKHSSCVPPPLFSLSLFALFYYAIPFQ